MKKVLCENKIGKYSHLHREVKKYAGRSRQEVKLILNKQLKLEPVYSVEANGTLKLKQQESLSMARARTPMAPK